MGNLIDPYGRNINYLRISIIDKCNLNCFYCVPEIGACSPKEGQVISAEDIIKMTETASKLGISKIRLTGGEPLIRKDIQDLVSRISAVEGINDLSLTTNGILLNELAPRLAEAGLNRVNISLDSLEPANFKKITRGGILEKTLNGIYKALEEGLTPVKINVVAMKGINDNEVSRFAELTLENDLHVRFIEYMPINSQHQKQWGDCFMPISEIKDLCSGVGTLQMVEFLQGNGPASYYRVKGARGLVGFISPVSRHFCAKCNRLRITSDGKIKPCLFSADEIDLLTAKGDVGKMEEMFLEALELRPDPEKIDNNPGGRFNCNKRGMLQIGG